MQLMCSYTHFYAKGVSQEHICGKGKTYQKGHTDAFHTTVFIDNVYVEDTFFTLGSLQKHVWTYASGLSDDDNYKGGCDNCPCATNPGHGPLAFVYNNYCCKLGDLGTFSGPLYYLSNTFWDGKDCTWQQQQLLC